MCLPLEILEIILSDPEIHRSESVRPSEAYVQNAFVKTRTLAACCSVSRTLRSLAEPLLYSTYIKPASLYLEENNNDEDSVLGYKLIQTPKQSLASFLCTTISRPELAQRIRRVILLPWEIPRMLGIMYKSALVSASQDLIETLHRFPLAESLPKFDTDRLNSDLLKGSEKSQVALLLAIAANIEDLSIVPPCAPVRGWPCGEVNGLMEYVPYTGISADVPPLLSKLKHLDICNLASQQQTRLTSPEVSLGNVRPRTVEILRVHQPSGTAIMRSILRSPIRTLVLDESIPDYRFLETVLSKMTPDLRSFKLTYHGAVPETEELIWLSITISSLVEHQGKTLDSVFIDTDGDVLLRYLKPLVRNSSFAGLLGESFEVWLDGVEDGTV